MNREELESIRRRMDREELESIRRNWQVNRDTVREYVAIHGWDEWSTESMIGYADMMTQFEWEIIKLDN